MRNIKNKLVLGGSSLLLATSLGLTGCASHGDRPLTRKIDDKATAMRVKHDLNEAPVYKFDDVNVTAYNGQVELSGFVYTEDQRREAGQIARKTDGVTSVINEIAIKPGTPVPTGRAYDQYQQRLNSNNPQPQGNTPPPPPPPPAPDQNQNQAPANNNNNQQ